MIYSIKYQGKGGGKLNYKVTRFLNLIGNNTILTQSRI